MSYPTSPICAALLVAFSCAQPPPDPRVLFERSAQRIERSSVFEYSFEYRETDGAAAVAALSGRATIERLALSGRAYRARVTGWEEDPRTGEPLQALDVAHDGERISVLDEAAATVWFSPLAAAGPSLLMRADPALMYPFFDPRSLAGEQQAAELRWEGTDEVSGVVCDSIRVAYDDDEEDSRWCIAHDHLPRRMEWLTPDGGSRVLEIAELATDVSIPSGRFATAVPDGYALRETDFGPPFGSPAQGWTLPRLGGGSVSLAELAGQVVFLDFWATWCSPCVQSLASLEGLRAEMADRPVSIFAVNAMESGDPVAFSRERGLTVPVLLDGDEVHDRYARGNLPAFVVIDPAGRHAGFGLGYFGELSERHARSLIERALSSDSPAP